MDQEATLHLNLVPEEEWPEVPTGASSLVAVYQVQIEVDGEYVTEFDEPIFLIFMAEPEAIEGLNEYQVFVFYWDQALEQWLALPTELAMEDGRLIITGMTDHLTKVAPMHDPGFPILTDLGAHWAWADVLKMASLGVVSGYPDNTFRPERQVTRAEFSKMIVQAARISIPDDVTLSFEDDVPAWARSYVAAAVEAGIIRGYPDNTFRPDQTITRAEMAVMLARAIEADLEDSVDLPFTDDIPEWAKAHVASVSGLRLIRGFPDGTFGSNEFTTRAQSCTVMWRMVHLLFR